MSLEKFVSLVAWGGCSAVSRPKYSIVCHTHGDHIVRDKNIVVVGPVRFLKRDIKSKYPIEPDTSDNIHIEVKETGLKITARVTVMGKKYLRAYGVERQLHCYPVIITVAGENALYIDDMDVQDKESVITLLRNLKSAMGPSLTTVLIPVYGGVLGHGARDPKELSEASKEVILYALSLGLRVVALGHKHIPRWVPETVQRIPRTLPVMRD